MLFSVNVWQHYPWMMINDPTDIMGCSKLETIWEEDEEDEETQPVVSP
ncbi:Protein of unknown function [Pyronema omphalodes CBS 100304]|uniref:Uncharacterized protein n=1 Tax=Pyronema omphalodes (strain CBS 100304) TaxID=1076935 RepID=U4KX41_PYROM|nr:Protein of unknown function [Pyronema omphalodes CBS 100304]